MAYIFDDAGFVTGTWDGPGQPANSTSVLPPDNAAQPLRFLNGAWVIIATPPDNKFITLLAFYSRFTQLERLQVRAAEARDPVTADLMMLVAVADHIDLDNEALQQGIAYLASTHLISVERAAEIIGAPIMDIERP